MNPYTDSRTDQSKPYSSVNSSFTQFWLGHQQIVSLVLPPG